MCASCNVKTDKPLWVREHSCPAWVRGGQRRKRSVEHSFSRTHRPRSGSLRRNVLRNLRFLVCERIAPRFVNVCGDCAPYGNHGGSCKARLPDSVWWAVRRSLTTSWKQEAPPSPSASARAGWGSSLLFSYTRHQTNMGIQQKHPSTYFVRF